MAEFDIVARFKYLCSLNKITPLRLFAYTGENGTRYGVARFHPTDDDMTVCEARVGLLIGLVISYHGPVYAQASDVRPDSAYNNIGEFADIFDAVEQFRLCDSLLLTCTTMNVPNQQVDALVKSAAKCD